MQVTIKDERRIDYTYIEIELSKEDLAHLINGGVIKNDYDQRIRIRLKEVK